MTSLALATAAAQIVAFCAVYARRTHTNLGAAGWLLLLTSAATLVALATKAVWSHQGLNLALPSTATLIICALTIAVIAGDARHRTWVLTLITLPAALVACAGILMANTQTYTPIGSLGEGLHILLAITGYSLLLATAVQAAGLAYQDHALRKHQLSRLVKSLPPIQSLETAMFRTMLLGTLMLGGAILLGFAVYDNLLERHVAHKTLFAILSFALYGAILIGRHTKGWSGVQAIKLTSIATVLLLLAYFGAETIALIIAN